MNKIYLFLNKVIERVIIDHFKQPILIIGMQMLKINKKGIIKNFAELSQKCRETFILFSVKLVMNFSVSVITAVKWMRWAHLSLSIDNEKTKLLCPKDISPFT